MDFEYDPQKSEANRLKHGIDFEEAKLLWTDMRGVEFQVALKEDEPRYLLIAGHSERHWTAVFTYRSSNIRIISVRRARLKEIMLYDNR